MYTSGKLYTINDSDFDLGCLPFPKLTIFGDRQLFDEENDSGLGMEEVSSSAQQIYKLQINRYVRF